MGNLTTSRGDAISGYFPNMAGTSGVKSYKNNLKAEVLSGTIANSGVVYAVTHHLGKVPSVVMVSPIGNAAQLKGAATSAVVVGEANVSAATTTAFYVAGAKNAKFRAFLLV